MSLFVVIEGVEAGGKSTLMGALVARLAGAGEDPLVTREPGGTALGQRIRELFLAGASGPGITPPTEAYLVNAARAQHVDEVLRPALVAGRTVLCDRFVDSTLAYQGYGRGLSLEWLRALCEGATGGLVPDLTLLVDVPIAVAAERMRLRGGIDRIERESSAFHERVRDGFLALAAAEPARYVILDGTLPPDRVLDRAWDALAAALSARGR